MTFGTDDGKEAIVWIYDLSGATAVQRLTFGGNNRFPVWSSDGKRVAYQSDREGDLAIWWQLADGTGPAERLTKPEQSTSHIPDSWSPKEDVLLFDVLKGTDSSLWTFALRDKKAAPFDSVQSAVPTGAVFSPDGGWVAYTSADAHTTTTIYVQPFPATHAKYQLVAKGSDNPHEVVWAPSGKELFYNPRVGGFEAVSVTTQPTFAFGNAAAVQRNFQLGPTSVRRAYDIMPDGKFVGLVQPGQTSAGTSADSQIQVVLNWFEELKQRAPTAR
jgi:Tol biopolymer transport system component